MAAAPATSSDFLSLLLKSGIIDDAKLATLGDLPEEPNQCATELINIGIITKFQAKLLLNGRYKGFKLGAYFIREQIGQGGMGAVYLAEHETLRRKVALKVLTLPKEGNAALSVERFLREARSAAALDHPNIVRLHDIGKQADTHFLVMEHVEGTTLDSIVSRGGPISSSRAVDYIAQAAAGLQHASEKGFIHRDIKPGNLMLTRDGQIKILDMGLARPADESKEQLTEQMDKGAIVGTADFLSPEQAMNGHLDVRSDIYSLGATFFALVTGQPPFSGNTTQKLIQHQMKEAPTVATLDKTFPPGLSDVVAKMLAKKPEHRYQSPAEVITALAEWLPQQASARLMGAISGTDLAQSSEMQATLSEIATGTKRIGTQTRLNAQQKSGRWFWPGLAAGILVLAGGTTAALSIGKKEEPVEIEQRDVPSSVTNNSSLRPKPEPRTEPKPKPKPAPAPPNVPVSVSPPASTGPVLLKLELNGSKSFTVTGTSKQKTEGGNVNKIWTPESSSGEGALPKGWLPGTFSSDCVAEASVREVDGRQALGIHRFSGGNSLMLSSPKFELPTGRFELTFQYKMQGGGNTLNLRFAQTNPSNKPAFDIHNTSNDKAGEWKTVTKLVDLKGASAGKIEFHPRGTGGDFIWIRDLVVRQAGSPDEKPTRDTALYSVNFKGIKPVNAKYDNSPKTFAIREIDKSLLPFGTHINQHRLNVSSEYFLGNLDGVAAFGMKLKDGDTGVQLHSNLGDSITQARPGDTIRMKITYRFDGEHEGNAAVQVGKSPYTKFQTISLTPTGGSWKTVEIVFVRPDDSEKYELIINCGNATDGKQRAVGMIYLSSIEAWYADAK